MVLTLTLWGRDTGEGDTAQRLLAVVSVSMVRVADGLVRVGVNGMCC